MDFRPISRDLAIALSSRPAPAVIPPPRTHRTGMRTTIGAPDRSSSSTGHSENWRPLRISTTSRLTELLSDAGHREQLAPHLLRQDAVDMLLPFEVADYVDFYA